VILDRLLLRSLIRAGLAYGLAFVIAPAAALVGPADQDNRFASHLVMIITRGVDKSGFCTGVVIGPRAVLTAAHCVVSIDNMRVFYRDEVGQPVLREVSAAVVNPNYRADAIAERAVSIDLALIETRAPLDARFSPADLDSSGRTTIGQSVRIFGYGLAEEGNGRTGGVLRAANLAIRGPLSEILAWVDDPAGRGAGACTGDSGGPIVAADSDKVLAIVAWTAGDRHGRRCGALTQGPLVAPQMQWIRRTLGEWRD
jgi:S1-C subfamily serine protease